MGTNESVGPNLYLLSDGQGAYAGKHLLVDLYGAVAGAECNTVIELKPEHHAA